MIDRDMFRSPSSCASTAPPGGSSVKLRRSSSQGHTPVRDLFRRFSLRYRKKKISDTPCERKRPHSFVNSQEWTLSRSVPDLKLGILGTISSCKSTLVHRYLTGSYMQEESPEGGRFKKEVIIDGQSYLLLIRDEGGPPEMQFTHWVDAVVFVFSLENETSFNAIYSYYAKMAHFRNTAEVPIILVGTQDAISESNPRVIDDTRARKLANDLKRSSYYETCATYGLNVERVFQDACHKIIQSRLQQIPMATGTSRTQNHSMHGSAGVGKATLYEAHSNSGQSSSGSGTLAMPTANNSSSHNIQVLNKSQSPSYKDNTGTGTKEKDHKHRKHKERERERERRLQPDVPGHPHLAGSLHTQSIPISIPVPPPTVPPDNIEQPPMMQVHPQQQVLDFRDLPTPSSTPVLMRKNKKANSNVQKSNSFSQGAALLQRAATQLNGVVNSSTYQQSPQPPADVSANPTPTSTPVLSRRNKTNKSFMGDKAVLGDGRETPTGTPTLSRKNRRRSNLFIQKKTEDEKNKIKNGEMGSGRVIPIKQGYLYKKSSKPLNKDWKKKYVTLLDDGRFSYFPSLHDYMDDVHGKEINLVRTTVKIPGQKPRGSRGSAETPASSQQTSNNNVSMRGRPAGNKEGVVLTGFDVIRETGVRPGMCEESVVIPNSSMPPDIFNNGGIDMFIHTSPQGGTPNSKVETPNVKKRHRRAKSGTNKNLEPGQDGDSDGYEFVIVSLDNKQWQFEASTSEEREEWVTAIEQQILASLQANESNKSKSNSMTDPAAGQAIRAVKGNAFCADCDAPNPDWASLNLGSLICIECSGIHRNLGTHLSRVRSLDLDEWPPELVAVMVVIGNKLVNMIWEANTKGRPKPTPTSSREEKERWIRSKYEQKEFLPPPPYRDVPLTQQLIDAIARQDVYSTILVLSYCNTDHVNTPYNKSDTRTALHIAAALGNVILMQLLLWYGANVSAVDHEGHNALWFARSAGSVECVELLHNQGCPDNPSLPRQRGSLASSTGGNDDFDRLPASII